jgi:hypothetical protein
MKINGGNLGYWPPLALPGPVLLARFPFCKSRGNSDLLSLVKETKNRKT